ncbi:MAG TPA: LytR C-terminal domain-containing protein, partial [Solirubrobacteraceae bacterium]|nr:LytR C-terminal domain-containing protein [Solirubrobacteraceae bacterium]
PPPPGRPAPLRAPTPSASLPPRTPAGARPRTDTGDGRSRGRLAAIVGAVVGVIAVLAVAGILIFGGGSDHPAPKPNTVAQPAANSTTGANGATTPSKAPAKLNRKAVPLAVLNGTTVTGLARGAADKLTAKGYNEPNVVTNDTTNQQRPTTQVYYEAKARAAALDVAKILGVPSTQIKPMDANARALADRAEVAVFVGGDKAQ